MTQLLSSQGVDITQRNFQQIIIRGDGKDQFNQMINQEISALPPSKNLEVKTKYDFNQITNSRKIDLFLNLMETINNYDSLTDVESKINNLIKELDIIGVQDKNGTLKKEIKEIFEIKN